MRRIGMKKRGMMLAGTVWWIFRMFMFIFVALSVLFMVRSFVSFGVDTRSVEMEVQAARAVTSTVCMAYFDAEIGRPYPGIVDLRKMSTLQLDSCIDYGERNDFITMHFQLFDLSEWGVENPEVLKESYLNELGWEVWLPRLRQKGPGGATARTMQRYVLYTEDGDKDVPFKPAVMKIDAIMPNS